MNVELIKHPTEEDWVWCKTCTLNTVGLKVVSNSVDDEWKKRLIESEHSPIRELWFGFRLTIPYWVSVHLVRHHIGCNHYVQSQRDDRQRSETISRADKPQGEMVTHILSINAQELVFMAHKRLCNQASKETREVVKEMCRLAIESNPELKNVLVPLCVYRGGRCTEMFPCNAMNKGVGNEEKV